MNGGRRRRPFCFCSGCMSWGRRKRRRVPVAALYAHLAFDKGPSHAAGLNRRGDALALALGATQLMQSATIGNLPVGGALYRPDGRVAHGAAAWPDDALVGALGRIHVGAERLVGICTAPACCAMQSTLAGGAQAPFGPWRARRDVGVDEVEMVHRGGGRPGEVRFRGPRQAWRRPRGW